MVLDHALEIGEGSRDNAQDGGQFGYARPGLEERLGRTHRTGAVNARGNSLGTRGRTQKEKDIICTVQHAMKTRG